LVSLLTSSALARSVVARGQTRAALKAFHIQEDANDPLGGEFERDSENKLDGVVREYAVVRLKRELANMTRQEDALRETRELLAEAEKY
jgi:predicted amidohydrolase YtcJ